MYDEILSKINRIMENYQEEEKYNIFDVLDVTYKEVPMCRFLADILNPAGRHGNGSYYLTTFLKEVLHRDDAEVICETAHVYREFLIDDERRIDIVIAADKVFIPIEVKIYAGDQDSQCFDYLSYARRTDDTAQVVYLTLWGYEPSSGSLANHDGTEKLSEADYICISFAEDIFKWLKKMVLDEKTDFNMKEILMQYAEAIKQMTSTIGEEKKMEIAEEMTKSEDNFRAMLAICDAEKQAKLKLLKDFMGDMEKSMSVIADEFNLKPEDKFHLYEYTGEQGDVFYEKKSESTWPGINYVFNGVELSRGIQMWFRIEIFWDLSFGICLFDPAADNGKGGGYNNPSDEFLEELKQYVDVESMEKNPDSWWIEWWYLPTGTSEINAEAKKRVPEFKNMNEAAINLVDSRKREEFIKESIDIIRKKLTDVLGKKR